MHAWSSQLLGRSDLSKGLGRVSSGPVTGLLASDSMCPGI